MSISMQNKPIIFPPPETIEHRQGSLHIFSGFTIYFQGLDEKQSSFLSRYLSSRLVSRFGISVRQGSHTAGGAVPIRAEIDKAKFSRENAEAFLLSVSDTGIDLTAVDYRGLVFGLQSLLQLFYRCNSFGSTAAEGFILPNLLIADRPRKAFRALRVFLPGKENLVFFKTFIADFLSFFRYNTLILEVNAGMEFERHPELNAGWYEFGRSLNFSRRNRPLGPRGEFQDSAHHDTGDFACISKEDLADLTEYARNFGINVFPEIPSLTHVYYLLTRHREFAEIENAEWPDTYCPLIPEIYDLYFDVVEEYREVMVPEIIHIGHDEWRIPKGTHLLTKDADYNKMYIDDVVKIHTFLSRHGIRTALWADHLMKDIRGGEHTARTSRTGVEYRIPGALTEEEVLNDIPKDILLFNWFWDKEGRGDAEKNEALIDEWGFEQVYGNFQPRIAEQDYNRRARRAGILGAAVSSWAASTAFNFGKDLIYDFTASSQLLWSHQCEDLRFGAREVKKMIPWIRYAFCSGAYPSLEGRPVISVAGNTVLEIAAAEEIKGKKDINEFDFDRDCCSLVFFHYCDRPASNLPAYYSIFNPPDSADLLGYYAIEYEDGFIVSVPLRYGVNIMERKQENTEENRYPCFLADPVPGDDKNKDIVCYSYEWRNERPGKKIFRIVLKSVTAECNAAEEKVTDNRVHWTGIAYTSTIDVKKPGIEEEGMKIT